MHYRIIGEHGPTVSSFGLGCMTLSDSYQAASEDESAATLDLALEKGITFLDTADFYASGHNEMLLGRTLRTKRQRVVLSVKFGALRDPENSWAGYDCRPAAVGNFLAMSMQRLHTDYIDLYVPARLDPQVPIEDTVGELARWVDKGYVRYIGLSEVSAATLRRAHKVFPISALQIEYSLLSRGIEAEVLPTCRELGITVVAYGTLSRGLLAGKIGRDAPLPIADGRRNYPRYQGENLGKNMALVERLRELADGRRSTCAQLALAWVAAQGDSIIPLIGARTRQQLTERSWCDRLAADQGRFTAD